MSDVFSFSNFLLLIHTSSYLRYIEVK